MSDVFFVLAMAVAVASAAVTLLAARAAARLADARPTPSEAGASPLAASLLRPLHGAVPGLAANLAATQSQRHHAPFEELAGVHHAADLAVPIARAMLAPSRGRLLANATLHGPNRKASQLHNLAGAAAYPILIAIDDDIRPPPDWVTTVVAPLSDPQVGLVTCLYRGVPADTGLWSRVAALGIDWQFLPFAALGERLGRANGCYGATMAIRRETLDRLGGFAAVSGMLADDHALGAAVRRLGLRVVVAPVLPAHVMAEPSLLAMFAHELRWARTIRLLDPAGAAGAALTHPVAWSILAAALAPTDWVGLAVLGLAMGARVALAVVVDLALARMTVGQAGRARIAGRVWVARLCLLPLRDALSFVVWLGGLARGSVTWQGRRYRMDRDGTMLELQDTTTRASARGSAAGQAPGEHPGPRLAGSVDWPVGTLAQPDAGAISATVGGDHRATHASATLCNPISGARRGAMLEPRPNAARPMRSGANSAEAAEPGGNVPR